MFPVAMALMGQGIREKRAADEEDQIDRTNRRQTEKDNQAWMAEQRANLREDAAFNKGERARLLKSREAVDAAAMPVQPQDGTVFQPTGDDEGSGVAMPANPTAGTYMGAGKRFNTRDEAFAAENTPERESQRIQRAMMATGDRAGARAERAGAQAERTGARQEQLADIQLTAAQQAAERDKGLREVGKLILGGGWASVPQVYDKYRDGAKATVAEDGKGGATVSYAGADGKTIGSKTYKALPEFFADVAGRFDPAKWFDYKNNQADKERVQANADRDFKLRESAETRRSMHEARMLSTAERSASAAELRASGADAVALTAESTFDRKTAVEVAKKDVDRMADTALANGKPMSPAEQARLMDQHIGENFQRHADKFIASTVQRELSAVKADPAAYAVAYAKAARNVKPEALAAMGFQAPAVPGAPKWGREGRPAVAPGAAQPPAVPAQVPPRAQMAATAPGQRNPFVDGAGRPLAQAPTGRGSALQESIIPAAKTAAGAVADAANARYVEYLAGKMERGEVLSPTERIRAEKLGLFAR